MAQNQLCNHARCDGHQQIVATVLHPLLTTCRGLQTMSLPVIDHVVLGAELGGHLATALPSVVRAGTTMSLLHLARTGTGRSSYRRVAMLHVRCCRRRALRCSNRGFGSSRSRRVHAGRRATTGTGWQLRRMGMGLRLRLRGSSTGHGHGGRPLPELWDCCVCHWNLRKISALHAALATPQDCSNCTPRLSGACISCLSCLSPLQRKPMNRMSCLCEGSAKMSAVPIPLLQA